MLFAKPIQSIAKLKLPIAFLIITIDYLKDTFGK